MKILLKFFGILLFVLIVGGIITYLYFDKPLPNGVQGERAEHLADEMLDAINKPAFDSLEYISFTYYKEQRSYQWDRKNKQVTVSWLDNEVFLDLTKSVEEYTLLEYKAYQFFINDTFWLVAPFKVRDDGVIRSSVDTELGRGLLVTYTSGGITPGDSYLWIVDEKGMPVAWRFWVSSIPIGGMEFSWEGWSEYNGVWFSTIHRNKIADVIVKDLDVR